MYKKCNKCREAFKGETAELAVDARKKEGCEVRRGEDNCEKEGREGCCIGEAEKDDEADENMVERCEDKAREGDRMGLEATEIGVSYVSLMLSFASISSGKMANTSSTP